MSSLSSSRSSPPTAESISSLLVQVKERQNDIDVFLQLVSQALDFIDHGVGKSTHQFCSVGGAPDFELQSCMLRCFGCRADSNVGEWQHRLAQAVYGGCLSCYKGYLQARDHLRTAYLGSYPKEKVDSLLDLIDVWEHKIALDVLDKKQIASRTGLAALSPPELYAVLTLVTSSRAQHLRQRLRDAIILQQLPNLQELVAGLLMYAVDDDTTIRTFAARQMIGLRPLTLQIAANSVFDRAIATVVSRLNDAGQEMDWSVVPMILRLLPRSAPALTAVILHHVHDRGPHLPDVLKAYTTVLRLRGSTTWNNVGDEDEEYPTVVLSGILDNPFFTQPLLQLPDPPSDPSSSKAPSFHFAWMSLHLESLKGQDRKGTHYTEALKRLANFLFERMQQGHVPNASRSVALKEAVDLVLRHADETNSRDVVDLYAPTIAGMALGTAAPDDETRAAARDLMLQAFERDVGTVSTATYALATLTNSHNALWKSHAKARKDPRLAASMDKVLSSEEVYEQAARDEYPSVAICAELWREAYRALGTRSGKEGYAVFLQALAPISVLTPPSPLTHLLEQPRHQADAYEAYSDRMTAAVSSLTKAIGTMRDPLAERLDHYGESATEDDMQALCIANAYSLFQMNLCPDRDIHTAAQGLLRQAFGDVEDRADCFRILLQINTAAVMRAIADFLQSFVTATTKLVEANELAKWMVRSFTDILRVLSDDTQGLLRPETSWSLVRDDGTQQMVALKLPDVWQLMCRSVAAIFRRTPLWSNLLPRQEMIAWFRDVTIFASDMVDALAVLQSVLRSAAKGNSARNRMRALDSDDEDLDSSDQDAMTEALALPLEGALSWLRMNDAEILRETKEYMTKALDRFKHDVELPASSKAKMLRFIDEQRAIPDANKRHTLLSVEDLAELRQLVDPPTGAIEISDSDDDSATLVGSEAGMEKERVRESSRPVPDNTHWWSSAGLFGSSITSSQEKTKKRQQQQQGKLKQQRLSFAKVDASKIIDVDAEYSGAKPKPTLSFDFTSSSKSRAAAAAASPAPPSAPINAYKGPSARASVAGIASGGASSSRANVPKAGTGKLAQLRQELGSTRTWRPQNTNVRSSASMRVKDEEPIVAPAATSSVTGVMGGKAVSVQKKAAQSDSSSSSSSSEDSSDEEAEAKGLAALSKKRSPLKPRGPTQPQPKRQIKVMEDPAISRARLERQEAERKRMLRSPPDYGALHRSILAWNYFHEGDRPPVPTGKEPTYRPVPPLLASANEYGQVFGPLLLLECWAQFQQAREEADNAQDKTTLEIAGRATVDQFVDLNATIAPNAIPKTFFLNDTEIVRLREVYPQHGQRPRTLLAKVQAFKRHPQGHAVTLRCCLIEDKQGISSKLVPRSTWELTKLFSLTTLHREFAALMTSAFYDLFQNVLSARVSPKAKLTTETVQKAMRNYQVNEPQARAIVGSLATPGFSLIQGPPGTGKTKTICALIGAFISKRKGPATSTHTGNRSAEGSFGPCKKILLCAPSNAAIDEVAKRAKAGVKDADGKTVYPRVVRIGREEGINVAVKDIALDHLIEQRLAGKSARDQDKAPPVDPSVLHAEIHALKKQREEKQAELSTIRNNPSLVTQLEAEIRNLAAKRLAAMSKLDEAKDKAQTEFRQQEADRRKARTDILAEADVICSTLAGAGHEMLNALPFDFETVVVDEAAQAVELSTIIPLRYGCKQCILVGDPNQLPPTVISQYAEKLRYSQSLFVRMFERSPEAVHLLSIQYRMHPEISVFPSTTFYDSKLKDGANMAQLTTQPWHRYELTRPFKFLGTKASEMPGRAHSLINREEANIALALYERLRQDYPQVDFDYRIGIVTMYKAQVFELKRTFAARYGQDIHHTIDFNTVDGFQGQEKDIIILSCVRSSVEPRSIGFLGDRRRINVAITRAKSNLFIIGNADHLSRSDPMWSQLVATARQRDALQNVTVSTFAKSGKLVAAKVAPPPPISASSASTSMSAPISSSTPGGLPQGPLSASKRPHELNGPGSLPYKPDSRQPASRSPAAGPPSSASASRAMPPPQHLPPRPVAAAIGANGDANGSRANGTDRKRGIVVRDDVPDAMAKRRKTDGDGISYGVPRDGSQANSTAAAPVRGPTQGPNGRSAPMRPPSMNGAAEVKPQRTPIMPSDRPPSASGYQAPRQHASARPRGGATAARPLPSRPPSKLDAMAQIPLGVPRGATGSQRPPPAQFSGPRGGSTAAGSTSQSNGASRAAPKPSDAALNSLFVKKRK